MRNRHNRLIRLLRVVALVLIWCASASPTIAQVSEPPPESVAPIPSPGPELIPAVEITVRAATAATTVREVMSSVSSDERLTYIQQQFPSEQQRIAELTEQTQERVNSPGSQSMINEVSKASLRVQERLDRWMKDLSTRSITIETTLQDLKSERSLWELTRDGQPVGENTEELSEALNQQIEATVEALQTAENRVRSVRDTVLDLQAAISQEKGRLDEILAQQQEEIARRSAGILSVDSPPLWAAFGGPQDQGSLTDQLKAMLRQQSQDLQAYLSEQGATLLIWLVAWLLLVAEIAVIRRKVQAWVQQDSSLEPVVAMLDQPVAAAAAIIIIANNILQAQAPTAWVDTINIVLLLALTALLPRLLSKKLLPLTWLLLPLFLLFRIVALAPIGSIVQRLALVALPLVGIAACVWFLLTMRRDSQDEEAPWQRAVVYGVRLAIALLAAGLIANFAGSVRFAALTVGGTIDAIFTALIFWVADALLKATVRGALLTKAARRLGIVPEHSDVVRDTSFRFVTVVLTGFFIAFVFKGFLIYDAAGAKISAALKWKLTIGEFSLVPGNFLIFIVIIWLSIKLAQLVEFVLSVVVLPKFSLPRGVPHTISRINRYAVIVIGIVVAGTAAGFDLDKATILIGGLGVGIGFGMQNVVNNFVSGLILLFERPIRAGDILEHGAASGTVEDIGMRATTVRTWQGSELIVPNASLISSDVVNWTLKHDRRRIEVPVGVAYDSDPDTVAQLLIDVANGHSEVFPSPEPYCLFKAFGDSSLDFELRAWAPATRGLRISSELRFEIARRLRDAKIEIPFPQRDIHLRSVDHEPPEGIRSEQAPSKETTDA